MVKVIIVGRVSDGFPLAQGLKYLNEENGCLSCYKQQAEFILQEISRGALTPTKMTIRFDHYCFNYLVLNEVVFMCDSSYPRKLAFHYLQDLQKEFEKFDKTVIDKITRPYSFVKFEMMGRLPGTPESASLIWGSPRLEVIAPKWTPIMTIATVSLVLLWAGLVLADEFIISSW